MSNTQGAVVLACVGADESEMMSVLHADLAYGSTTEANPTILENGSDSRFTMTPHLEVERDNSPDEFSLGVGSPHHESRTTRTSAYVHVLRCSMKVGRLYPCACRDNSQVVAHQHFEQLPDLLRGFTTRWAFTCPNGVAGGEMFANEVVFATLFPGDIVSEVMSFLYPWDIHPIFSRVASPVVTLRSIESADDSMVAFGLTEPMVLGIDTDEQIHPGFCWGSSEAVDSVIWGRTTRVYVPDLTTCGDVESNPGPGLRTFKTYITTDAPSRVEKFTLSNGKVATPSLKFAFYNASHYKGTRPRISKQSSMVGTKAVVRRDINALPNHLAGCTCRESYQIMSAMKKSSRLEGLTLIIEPNEFIDKRYVRVFTDKSDLEEMLYYEVSGFCPCGLQFLGRCLATKTVHIPHYEFMAREAKIEQFNITMAGIRNEFRELRDKIQASKKTHATTLPSSLSSKISPEFHFELGAETSGEEDSGRKQEPPLTQQQPKMAQRESSKRSHDSTVRIGMGKCYEEMVDSSFHFGTSVPRDEETRVVESPQTKVDPKPSGTIKDNCQPSMAKMVNDVRSLEGLRRHKLVAQCNGISALHHRHFLGFIACIKQEQSERQRMISELSKCTLDYHFGRFVSSELEARECFIGQEHHEFSSIVDEARTQIVYSMLPMESQRYTRARLIDSMIEAAERRAYFEDYQNSTRWAKRADAIRTERVGLFRSEAKYRELYIREWAHLYNKTRQCFFATLPLSVDYEPLVWKSDENRQFHIEQSVVAFQETAERSAIESSSVIDGVTKAVFHSTAMLLQYANLCLDLSTEVHKDIQDDYTFLIGFKNLSCVEGTEADDRRRLVDEADKCFDSLVSDWKKVQGRKSFRLVSLMDDEDCECEVVSFEGEVGHHEYTVIDNNAASCHKIISRLLGKPEISSPVIGATQLFGLLQGLELGLTFITHENACVMMPCVTSEEKDVHICIYLNDEMRPVHVSAHLIMNHSVYRTGAEITDSFLGLTFGKVGVGGLRDFFNKKNREFVDTPLARYRNVDPRVKMPVNKTPSDPERRGILQAFRGAFRTRHHESNNLQADTVPATGLQFLHFANCRVVLKERPIKFAPAFPSLYTYESVLEHSGNGVSKQFEHFKCNCFETHRNNTLNPGYIAIARVKKMSVVDRGFKPNTFLARRREERIDVHSETTMSCHQSHLGYLRAAVCTMRNSLNGQYTVNCFNDKLANDAFAAAVAPGAQAQESRNALIKAGTLNVEDIEWLTSTMSLLHHTETKIKGTFSDTVTGTFSPTTVACQTAFAGDDVQTSIAGFHYPEYSACCHTSRKSNHCSACMNARLCDRCGRCITRVTLRGMNSLQKAVRAYCGFCSEGDPVVSAWKCIRDDTSTTIIPPLGVYPMVSTVFARTPALKKSDLGAGVQLNVLTEVHAGKQAGPQAVGICPAAISPICTVLDTVNMLCSLSSRQLATQITPDSAGVASYVTHSEQFIDKLIEDLNNCGYINGTISPKRMSNFLKNYNGPKRQRYADALAFCMPDDARRRICEEVNCEFRPMNQLDLKNSLKDLYQRSIFLKNEMLNKTTCPYQPDDNAGRVITSCTSPVPNVILGPWVAATQAVLKKFWSIEGIPQQSSKVKVLFACGKDCAELGDYYAYAFNNYKYLVGLDYKKYDSNQKSFHHHVEGYLYRKIGFGRAAMRCFEAQSRNRATASIRGTKVIRATWRWRRNSGDPNTTCGNSVLNVSMLTWAIEECAKILGISPEDFLVLVGGDDGMIASQHPPEIWQPIVDALLHKKLGMPLSWQLSEDPWTIRFMGALPYPVEGGAIRTGPCFERFISKIGYMCTPNADVLGWMKGVAECWMTSFSHVPFIPAFCEPMLRTAANATANYKKDGFLYAQSTTASPVSAAPESLEIFRRQLLDIGVSTTISGIEDMLNCVRNIQHLPVLVSHPILNMVGQVSYNL